MPRFIQDYFKLDPAFFCNSEYLTAALEEDWEFKARNVLSLVEKIECDRLDVMEDEVNAEVRMFISRDQQRVLALDDSALSEETQLIKRH